MIKLARWNIEACSAMSLPLDPVGKLAAARENSALLVHATANVAALLFALIPIDEHDEALLESVTRRPGCAFVRQPKCRVQPNAQLMGIPELTVVRRVEGVGAHEGRLGSSNEWPLALSCVWPAEDAEPEQGD
eukprot:CAMPEP_0181202148 /NCGR_PEP_ID=MMETSP1096-20121128/18684_1 /TAXON_ID=156174 ORGANISM="Chrysochromulina ericina, Strain CCMP281" /NCGR_SAMPLE_ID=MMETSP1096 /ASSEMBLY_ACC=CAM_ASM_000453 /LENGTH=132 /DNA_ID=CAMNT_0023292635 /DNA_START=557 /DNA_END=956 /DNA_ORIENTATION=+